MKRENGMQCEQLQRRLNDLLDLREDLRSDAELVAHASECDACERLVRAYESMLLGIDVIGEPEPEPEDEFVRRAVDSAERRRRRARLAQRVLVAATIAAAVLIAALPAWRATRPLAPSAGEGAIAAGSSIQPNGPAPLKHPEPSPEAFGRMLQATGRNLAAFPQTVRRVAAHPTTYHIVGPMRPLAEPFGATWEVLLRAWPAASAPAPVIPESDTGYIAWHDTQHA